MKTINTNLGTCPEFVFNVIKTGARLPDEWRVWQTAVEKFNYNDIQEIDSYENLMYKENEAVFIFNGYVYKWFKDIERAKAKEERAKTLKSLCPSIVASCDSWFCYKFAPGELLTARTDLLYNYMGWMQFHAWKYLSKLEPVQITQWSSEFYRLKTKIRLQAYNYYPDVDWDEIADKCLLTNYWHGDCSFENVICKDGCFTIIDWRENTYGDVYYDIAKLLKSIYFDHRTVTADGSWLPHYNWSKLRGIMRGWCFDNNYDWKHVKLICALAFFAMAGSHSGSLGQSFFDKGKELL